MDNHLYDAVMDVFDSRANVEIKVNIKVFTLGDFTVHVAGNHAIITRTDNGPLEPLPHSIMVDIGKEAFPTHTSVEIYPSDVKQVDSTFVRHIWAVDDKHLPDPITGRMVEIGLPRR